MLEVIPDQVRHWKRWWFLIPVAMIILIEGVMVWFIYVTVRSQQLQQLQGESFRLARKLDSLGAAIRKEKGLQANDKTRLLLLAFADGEESDTTHEVVIGRVQSDQIQVLSASTESENSVIAELSPNAPEGRPLQLALKGESGAGEFLDYRGVSVLAGYAQVPSEKLGVVCKVNLAAVEWPFFRMSLIVAGIGLLVASGVGRFLTWLSRRTSDQLTHCQSRISSLSESVPAIVLVLSLKGHVRYINPYGEQITGFKCEELLGKDWFELFLPATVQEKVRSVFQSAVTGPPTRSYRNSIISKSGVKHKFEWNDQVLLDANGQVEAMLAVGIDVTDRQQRELAVMQIEARHRLLIERAQDLIFRMSIPDGKYEYVSPSSESVIGHSASQLLTAPLFIEQVIHPNYKQWFQREWQKICRGEIDPLYEYAVLDQNGQTIWIQQSNVAIRDDQGKIVALEGICRNVTRCVLRETALRQSSDRIRQILDSLYGFVCVFSPEGFITEINNATLKAAGKKRSEVIGQRLQDTGWIGVETASIVLDAMSAAIRGASTRGDYIATFPKLGRRVVDAIFSPLQGENNKVVGVVVFGIDVTDRKATEQAHSENEARLRAVVEGAFDAIVITDVQSRRFTYGNSAACHLFGVTPDQLVTFGLKDIHSAEYCREYEEHFLDLAGGHRQLVLNAIVVKRDRTERLVDISVSPVTIGGRPCVIAVMRDCTEQRQAERRLLQNKHQLKRAQEIARLGSWEYNLLTGELTWPEQTYRVFGIDPAKFVLSPESFYALLEDGDADRLRETFRRSVTTGEPYRISYRVRSPSGQLLYFEEHGEFEFGPGVAPIRSSGTVQDVTGRTEAEAALRESEQRILQVLREMPILLIAVDKDRKLVVWNKECVRVTGADSDEVLCDPQAWERLFPEPISRESLLNKVLFGNGDIRGWTTELTCKAGERRVIEWASVSAQIAIPGWAGWAVGVDVTERRQAEQALRVNQDRLREVVRCAEIGVFDHNHITQQIYWSTEQFHLHGRPEGEIVNFEDYPNRVHPDDRDRTSEAVRRAHDPAGDGVFDTEYRYFRPGESLPRWLLVRSKTEFAGVGEHRHAVRSYGAMLDITDRIRANESLKLAHSELQRRLDELTEVHTALSEATARRQELEVELNETFRRMCMSAFAGGIAHELNQPLTTIHNYSRGCLRRLKAIQADREFEEAVQAIAEEAQRSGEIIQSLRSLILSRPVELDERELNVCVGQAHELIQPLARSYRAHVIFTPCQSLPLIRHDPLLVTQAVLNLLTNAIEAMQAVEAERVVELETSFESGAIIAVHDRGPGLPDNIDLQKVLKSTKEAGTGLGLLVTRNIVELHGGQLYASARVGGGTSFYIAFRK